jgi:hypothetical protein
MKMFMLTTFKVYCSTETWLNDTILSHNLFPDSYCVFRADRDYLTSNTKRGGGVLVAVSKSFRGVKRRYDLETIDECVWVEIPVPDNNNLFIGNHYFAPDCDVKIIENYLNLLEQNSNTHQYLVIILDDFNVPKYGWLNGTPLSNCYYYDKIKGNLIYATSCFLDLNQPNNYISSSALLDLVFTIINDLCVSISNYPVAAPDNYHPPLNLDFKLTFDSQLTFLIPRRNYGQGDYLLLYKTLCNYAWSCVLNENSVDSAVYNFTASVSETINETISMVKPKNSSFPDWFSKSLIYYFKKISF